MKLSFVEMCGFRGYRDRIRVDFGTNFTIIDGRNGAGKSTIFDAVEYALTGSIAKYQRANANQDSVDNYIWWLGDTQGPEKRYVSIGFIDEGLETVVTRTSLKPSIADKLDDVVKKLFDDRTDRDGAIKQICASAIIRDELITALSLDLKDSDRYALLSSAIGAIGADDLIAKAKEIHSAAKDELETAVSRSEVAKNKATKARIHVDEQRARVQDDLSLKAGLSELESLLGRRINLDDASSIVTKEIVLLGPQEKKYHVALNALRKKADSEQAQTTEKNNSSELLKRKAEYSAAIADRNAQLQKFNLTDLTNKLASQLSQLASLGEDVGCGDGTCPVCKSSISVEQYKEGIRSLRSKSAEINTEIAESTELKNEISELEMILKEITKKEERISLRIKQHEQSLIQTNNSLERMFPQQQVSESFIVDHLEDISSRMQKLMELTPRIDIRRRSVALQRSELEYETKRSEDQQAERDLSLAQKKETDCKKLFDSVRKAANDTFNQRLNRILPLITELYARLRPHPNFQKIDYNIRGELRRQLSFSVGGDINPQFVFSSGQRRATGLAFLISVNLSMAWSRWSSLLLDDPVQHIDDFRSVHLAELLGHLVREKRQIICAVEDPALADLLCRKMPVAGFGAAKRLTLGVDKDGNVTALRNQEIQPMPRNILQPVRSNLAV